MQIIASPEVPYSLHYPIILILCRRKSIPVCFRNTKALFVAKQRGNGHTGLFWKPRVVIEVSNYQEQATLNVQIKQIKN